MGECYFVALSQCTLFLRLKCHDACMTEYEYLCVYTHAHTYTKKEKINKCGKITIESKGRVCGCSLYHTFKFSVGLKSLSKIR